MSKISFVHRRSDVLLLQFYYGTSYFAGNPDSGLPSAFILQVITNVVNVVTTFPGLYAIDKFGRRFVLLTGALGMGISQYIVAACGVATGSTNQASQAAQFAFVWYVDRAFDFPTTCDTC